MSYITNLRKKILSEVDKPLFEDATKSADAGAFRGAYIMLWLSCAESLKRRFKESSPQNNIASKIFHEIKNKEEQHRSVDKYILDKSKEYGFITDSDHQELSLIYGMRCVYGHPYEKAPNDDQLYYAASTIVRCVLSKPLKLKEGFASQIINDILTQKHYLDHQYKAVESFTHSVLLKIDENIYDWFLKKLWEKTDKIISDIPLSKLVDRAIWFSKAMLQKTGLDIIAPEEWHQLTIRYPIIFMRLFSYHEFFENIDRSTQDSLIGIIIEESDSSPSELKRIENLCNKGSLTEIQKTRFLEACEIKNNIFSAELELKTIFNRIIDNLKSHTWPKQNPTIDYISNSGIEQISNLKEHDQEILGRNILQCAEGSSRSAETLVKRIARDPKIWPCQFLAGMIYEAFFNEEKEIRLKIEMMEELACISEKIIKEKANIIAENISTSINNGQLRPSIGWHQIIEKTVEKVEASPLLTKLISELKEKVDREIPEDSY